MQNTPTQHRILMNTYPLSFYGKPKAKRFTPQLIIFKK